MSSENTHDAHAGAHTTMTKSTIWKVFFYLVAVTAIEFFIALYMHPHGYVSNSVKNFIYVILTLVKAFYIVAYFMHLKYEKLALKTGITISLIFIVYFIILLLTEGSYLHLHMN